MSSSLLSQPSLFLLLPYIFSLFFSTSYRNCFLIQKVSIYFSFIHHTFLYFFSCSPHPIHVLSFFMILGVLILRSCRSITDRSWAELEPFRMQCAGYFQARYVLYLFGFFFTYRIPKKVFTSNSKHFCQEGMIPIMIRLVFYSSPAALCFSWKITCFHVDMILFHNA
jgi:hypothetical protein